jgi:hypothetical protein
LELNFKVANASPESLLVTQALETNLAQQDQLPSTGSFQRRATADALQQYGGALQQVANAGESILKISLIKSESLIL